MTKPVANQLVVEYLNGQTRYYQIGPGRGWAKAWCGCCLMVGQGLPRTMIPLANVASYTVEYVAPPPSPVDKALRDFYESIIAPTKFDPGGLATALNTRRHRCAICGKPGPVKHEGDTWVCPDCAVVAGKAKDAEERAEPALPGIDPSARRCSRCLQPFEPGHACAEAAEPGQEGAEAEDDPAFVDTEADRDREMAQHLAADPFPHCHKPVGGGYCHRTNNHGGDCSTSSKADDTRAKGGLLPGGVIYSTGGDNEPEAGR